MFGDGKTSLRGGFGVSYESTLYNPLSNSRWNPPFYSFNGANNALVQPNNPSIVVYGPTTCTNGANCVPSGATPTFTGPATNPGQGIGAQATGNINGWASSNPDQAKLTGIVLPQGIRDPYVYSFFLSVQREVVPKLVVEADYVGTTAHKLFRASDINTGAGDFLPAGGSVGGQLWQNVNGTAELHQRRWAPKPELRNLAYLGKRCELELQLPATLRQEADEPWDSVQCGLHVEPLIG